MADQEKIKKFGEQLQSIFTQIRRDVVGQQEVVEGTVIAMIAGGNVLLEGVPGVGKTRLVRSLGRVFDLPFSRIQFTPDLMPADVTGTNIIVTDEKGNSAFRFQEGPIFSNIILADEINRATPKTQSALLEAMQEHKVTVMGVSRTLYVPFFVLATQNPIEQDGTYPLPEGAGLHGREPSRDAKDGKRDPRGGQRPRLRGRAMLRDPSREQIYRRSGQKISSLRRFSPCGAGAHFGGEGPRADQRAVQRLLRGYQQARVPRPQA